MADLHISWSDYHRSIEQLALMVHRSSWPFNQIVCLAKGGLRVGDIICRISNQPLAILSTSSYGGEGNRTRGSITFSNDLSMTTANLGSRVLLVDDLVDSGQSLQRSIAWLENRYGFYIDEVRTAVLWHKECSVITPDYAVHYLEDNPWIHQPFEHYEEMSWDTLASSLGSSSAASMPESFSTNRSVHQSSLREQSSP
ncbi:MAG: putative phosphoribosyltransferase [Phormidesmis priestleyi Ana]|uniref:Putative phosphoribosyltransferase n=1 Tax=Phormidesmis priestleyi Ana TaxID=1666911 RepID=A0A0N8KNB2_9CYAN|nr:MAG: putative phosphoribosyltransferase [Phormidesmis priestleyi Ana]